MSEFVAQLDPDAPALFAVAWAGDTESNNRFDTAREFTERWHHQMQIRLALGPRGAPGVLLAPRFSNPLLRTAAHVLPHAYREVAAAEGTAVTLRVKESASDGTNVGALSWTLRHEAGRWHLFEGVDQGESDAEIVASADVLWQLLFNALTAADAPGRVETRGPEALLRPFWAARSVMV